MPKLWYTMKNPIYRIILVDDHPLLRMGLREVLKTISTFQTEILAECEDGETLLRVLKTTEPDLIFLDLKMPKLNGLEAIQLIRKENTKVKILIFTMLCQESSINALLEAGANGYLCKHSQAKVVEEAIISIMAGKQFIGGSFEQPATSKEKIASPNVLLTNREKEVLKLIVAGKGNKEIAKILYISYQTVNVHRKNIIRKLDAGNTVGLIHLAIKNQLV